MSGERRNECERLHNARKGGTSVRATTREAEAAAGAASVKDCIMHCCCTQGAASPAAYSSVCGLKLLLYKVLSSQCMRPRLLSAPELPGPHTVWGKYTQSSPLTRLLRISEKGASIYLCSWYIYTFKYLSSLSTIELWPPPGLLQKGQDSPCKNLQVMGCIQSLGYFQILTPDAHYRHYKNSFISNHFHWINRMLFE